MEKALRVGIIGHTGYIGEELMTLLARHRQVAACTITLPRPERSAAAPVGEFNKKALGDARRALRPDIARARVMPPMSLDEAEHSNFDAVLLATPLEVSLDLAPRFLACGTRVIDLSGAFRLKDAQAYSRHYGADHPQPELLAEAVYGLSELAGPALATARLVANPGCHAAAVCLALAPLCSAGLIAAGSAVVCDSKSGVSGAGKKATAATHFCAVSDNFLIYNALSHRHVGEILEQTGLDEAHFSFVAQLLPVRRGILATLYFNLAPGKDAGDIGATYEGVYGASPCIGIYARGAFPSLDSVVGRNVCHIGYDSVEPGRRAVVAVALDNLSKGAAGQAIQNLNLMFGLDETEGLH
jgi:N-acetyl-gamma-glutamyl-phosphate reductase